MGVDPKLLEEQCRYTLERTDFAGAERRIPGKVRDSYVRGGKRAIVVSDRVSAFDRVLGTIPFKGQVLNQMAAFWFEQTASIARNHLISVPDPCASLVRECQVLPVEFVYRGYLTGVTSTSIWTAYSRGERLYCGHRLPDGLKKHQQLPEPLLTPTTKAPKGGHDEPVSRAEVLERCLVSEALYERAASLASALFREGQTFAASRGLILADTKYELGLDEAGTLVVADEIHTPDSSRYWYADSFEQALRDGGDPRALDKEYVRRWLVAERCYRGEGAPPPLPDEVRCEAAARYIEAYERVTGLAFEADADAPEPRIRRNLGLGA